MAEEKQGRHGSGEGKNKKYGSGRRETEFRHKTGAEPHKQVMLLFYGICCKIVFEK